MDDLARIISTLGFPIVISVILMIHTFSMSDNFEKTIEQNTETLKMLVEALQDKNIIIEHSEVDKDNDNTNNGQGNNGK